MINYQSSNPSKNFLMIDKRIDDILSSDAYFLLVKLMKLAPKECNSNKCLMEKTGLSRRRFEAAKKELVETGYLETQQLWDNRYALYIGIESVKNYRHRKKGNNRHEQSELRKLRDDAEMTKK
jgi:hypothetical protein